MISLGSCIYPTLDSVKVLPSRVASPEKYASNAKSVRSYAHLPYNIDRDPRKQRIAERASEKDKQHLIQLMV